MNFIMGTLILIINYSYLKKILIKISKRNLQNKIIYYFFSFILNVAGISLIFNEISIGLPIALLLISVTYETWANLWKN